MGRVNAPPAGRMRRGVEEDRWASERRWRLEAKNLELSSQQPCVTLRWDCLFYSVSPRVPPAPGKFLVEIQCGSWKKIREPLNSILKAMKSAYRPGQWSQEISRTNTPGLMYVLIVCAQLMRVCVGRVSIRTLVTDVIILFKIKMKKSMWGRMSKHEQK